MRPETIGRVFGVGVRVAGRVAAQRLSAAGSPAAPQAASASPAPRAQMHTQMHTQGHAAGQTGGSLSSGLRRGATGFFRPLGRASHIVWLQVTGLFFLLPVLVFAPTLWRTRLSWAHGPDHRTFLAAAAVVVVFLYLGVSSFWRARKR